MRITKQQLRAFRTQANEIRLLAETIRAMRETLGAKVSDANSPAVHGGNSSAMERAVEKIIDIERKYQDKVDDYAAQREQIESAIEKLLPNERAVIRLYYLDCLTWEETADKIQGACSRSR